LLAPNDIDMYVLSDFLVAGINKDREIPYIPSKHDKFDNQAVRESVGVKYMLIVSP
jgi:hypothetical protein